MKVRSITRKTNAVSDVSLIHDHFGLAMTGFYHKDFPASFRSRRTDRRACYVSKQTAEKEVSFRGRTESLGVSRRGNS